MSKVRGPSEIRKGRSTRVSVLTQPCDQGVCVVVGAGTKYASNTDFFGDAPKGSLSTANQHGLGGALPLIFAEQGYDVAIMSRSMKNLLPIEQLIAEGGSGRECLSVECDCSSPASIKTAFAAVRANFGEDSINVLCYNGELGA